MPRYTTARMAWRLNKAPVRVSGLAQALSKSPNSVIDAAAENTKDALKMLQRNMNRQLLSDGLGNINGVDPDLETSGTDITGILAAWDDGSAVPTYANLNRNVALFWQSFVLANGGVLRPITEELMHQVFNEVQGIREGRITDMTCSLDLFTQVGLLLGQDRRYNVAANANATPSYAGGFQKATFNGVEITGIPLYQNNRMDMWDRDLLDFKVLLDFTIEPRDAGDQDAMVMFAKTYSQLCYKNPYHSASIRDLIQ